MYSHCDDHHVPCSIVMIRHIEKDYGQLSWRNESASWNAGRSLKSLIYFPHVSLACADKPSIFSLYSLILYVIFTSVDVTVIIQFGYVSLFVVSFPLGGY